MAGGDCNTDTATDCVNHPIPLGNFRRLISEYGAEARTCPYKQLVGGFGTATIDDLFVSYGLAPFVDAPCLERSGMLAFLL